MSQNNRHKGKVDESDFVQLGEGELVNDVELSHIPETRLLFVFFL